MKNNGLTDAEVLISRQQNGSNVIPDSKPVTFWDKFKEAFADPMIKILLAVAALMLGLFFVGYGQIYEPVGTIVAVIIVAFVSAKTAVASDDAYRKLKDNQKKDVCKVFRNGDVVVVDVDDVVVGDWVLLYAGDKIPADGVLVQGDLTVDNSALNGETDECKKTATTLDTDLPETVTGDTFVDAHSLFRGMVVFGGNGVLNVRRVGINSVMGKMAKDMHGAEPDSPLKVKLGILAGYISKFGYTMAALIAVAYIVFYIVNAGGVGAYLDGGLYNIIHDFVRALSLATVIVVCAVPEGLPLMISLVLMQNTKKMLNHNVLVRKAIGIETAGSLNILFSDKTGTITNGVLDVVEFFTADGRAVSVEKSSRHKELKNMLNVAIGMNVASVYDAEHNVVGGNATDRALVRFLGENEYLRIRQGGNYTAGAVQTFNSANKFSQVEVTELGKTFYMGAPEKIIGASVRALDADGNVIGLNLDVLNAKINALADRAMRVLAFGYSEGKLAENKINKDVVIIGFVAIRDDVRLEAKVAVREVQNAGIQVVMITGDRLETAVAIAKDAGIVRGKTDVVLTSAQLAAMSDDDIKSVIKNLRVVARALPTDKSRLVRICQEMNLVCGMTGDGVNDVPALKRADVGFAMGGGTDAAKEAGEIVVLDDNFKSIKDAILYGRTIYNNILKFCKFQLAINVAAVAVSMVAPFFGIDEPLKVTHLLFVNLVMDGLGAIMLGNEPALDKYMRERPRKRDESIINKKMMMQILVMGIWLTVISVLFLKLPFFNQFFDNDAQKYTAYFVMFIMAALFNGFNVRSDGYGIFSELNKNPNFIKVFLAIVGILVVIVNSALVPWGVFAWIGKMFACVPFGLAGWCVVVLMASTMIFADFVRKYIVVDGATK